MKSKMIAVLFLVLVAGRARADLSQESDQRPNSSPKDIPYADAVTFLGIEQIAQQVRKAVFAAQVQGDLKDEEKRNDWISRGTGFFVLGERDAILGVTCSHVVEGAGGNPIYAGVDTKKGYKRISCKVIFQDKENDIAVLALLDPKEKLQFQNLTVPESMFDDNSSLLEGRGVMIPGYPLKLGLEDEKNNPVIRIGIVAQFTGKNYFLIDGSANPGNSGSPVFALNHKNSKLVGMITSHEADVIELYDKAQRLVAMFPYNSGLARAVTLETIKEVLQKARGSY